MKSIIKGLLLLPAFLYFIILECLLKLFGWKLNAKAEIVS